MSDEVGGIGDRRRGIDSFELDSVKQRQIWANIVENIIIPTE